MDIANIKVPAGLKMNDHNLSSVSRARGRPRTIDPDKILDVAMTHYWRYDPADISINSICRLANVSKPSLYREFGNEDGLMRAALDRYVRVVLSETVNILQAEESLNVTLDRLIDFICIERMESGCLFYKMWYGKHRLGSETLERLHELAEEAQALYEVFLEGHRDSGEWEPESSIAFSAQYLLHQIGLASMLRTSGQDSEFIRNTLSLAFSVFTSSRGGATLPQ